MTVKVWSSYRIHLGFYRFNDDAFIYGSLGASITDPSFELTLQVRKDAEDLIVESPTREGEELIRHVLETASPGFNGFVGVKGFVRHHVGFGTRTRLVLAVLTAVKRLGIIGKDEFFEAISKLGIGKYSAVGLYTFLRGGLVIDSGRPVRSKGIPKLIARLPIPKAWRVVLALPTGIQGLPESSENPIMNTPKTFKRQGELYSSILTLIYSLKVGDFKLFTNSIDRIQGLTGEYFSKYQGGEYCCDESRTIAERLRMEGLSGIGQSSWGPLVYGFADSLSKADEVAESLTNYLREIGIGHEVWVTRISGLGHSVSVTKSSNAGKPVGKE